MLNQRVISFKRRFFTRWHTACSALWLSVVKRIWWIELSWCPKSKSKAIFLAIQNKGKYYNHPIITQTKKNKPPQVRDNAKARVKIEISFFDCLSQWLWLVDLEKYGGYIYIYSTSGNNFLYKPKYLDWPHDLFCLVQKCTRTGV